MDGIERGRVRRHPGHAEIGHADNAVAQRSTVAMAVCATAMAVADRMRRHGLRTRGYVPHYPVAVRSGSPTHHHRRLRIAANCHRERLRKNIERQRRPREQRQCKQAAKKAWARTDRAAHARQRSLAPGGPQLGMIPCTWITTSFSGSAGANRLSRSSAWRTGAGSRYLGDNDRSPWTCWSCSSRCAVGLTFVRLVASIEWHRQPCAVNGHFMVSRTISQWHCKPAERPLVSFPMSRAPGPHQPRHMEPFRRWNRPLIVLFTIIAVGFCGLAAAQGASHRGIELRIAHAQTSVQSSPTPTPEALDDIREHDHHHSGSPLQDLLTLGHTHAECPCAASAVDVFVIGVVPDTTLVVRREAERRQDGPSGSPFRPPIV